MNVETERIQTDVLIIGGGVAGCAGAIAAAEQGRNVVLAEKAWTGGSGASTFATGGFYWFDPERHSIRDILEKTNKSSCHMFDPEWMEWFCRNVHDLIIKFDEKGVPFRKDENGSFVLMPSRGGTELVLVPGYIFQKKMRSLVSQANVRLLDRIMITRLLTSGGEVTGAAGFNVRTGKFYVIEAKNTVLAAGGCSYKGNFFGQDMLCGEGLYMASLVGAEFTNMEFSNCFNTTAKDFDLFGLGLFPRMGAKFMNSRGEYFMERYDPVHKDNSLLNTVLLAMATEVKEGRGPIYFDMSLIPEEKRQVVRETVPLCFEAFDSKGIDPYAQPLEWMPAFLGAASCGSGLTLASFNCDTTVPGLYAAGDVSNEGLIIGGSLGPGGINISWALVTGWKAGEAAAVSARSKDIIPAGQEDIEAVKNVTFAKLGHTGTMTIDDAVLKVQAAVIPARFSILRSETSLREGLSKLKDLEQEIDHEIIVRDTHELMSYHELPGMLSTAKMTYMTALLRTESRGSHFREDYPGTDDKNWLAWTKISNKNNEYIIKKEPVSAERFKRCGLELPL